jgi:hypothetical protein
LEVISPTGQIGRSRHPDYLAAAMPQGDIGIGEDMP